MTYDAGIDELWKIDRSQVDLLIVLGGPLGSNDDALYPFLAEEVELVRQRLDSGRALLGICLGAQLMARALGAAVTPMDRKEICFSPLSLTPQGCTSPLVHIGTHPVLHWHGDQFDFWLRLIATACYATAAPQKSGVDATGKPDLVQNPLTPSLIFQRPASEPHKFGVFGVHGVLQMEGLGSSPGGF